MRRKEDDSNFDGISSRFNTNYIQREQNISSKVASKFDITKKELIILLLSLSIIITFYLIYISKTDLVDYDEGVYLLSSHLYVNNFKLYSQIFISQTPLLFEFVKITNLYVSNLLIAGRITVVLFSSIGFIGTSLCCLIIVKNKIRNQKVQLISESKAWLVIPLSMVLLGFFSKYWIYHARVIMPNVPQASFSILSLWFFYQSIKTINLSVWEFLAGMSLSLGLLFKLFGVIPILFIFLYYLFSKNKKKKTILFLVGLILPLFFLFKYNLVEFFNQAVLFHTEKNRSFMSIFYGFEDLINWFQTDIVIFALAILAIIPILNSKNRFEIIALVWTIYNIIVLSLYSPIYEQHYVHIIPAMVVIATISLFNILNYLKRFFDQLKAKITNRSVFLNSIVSKIYNFTRKITLNNILKTTFVLVVIFGTTSPIYFNYIDTSTSNEKYLLTADFIAILVQPDEFFLTDSPSVAYFSNRNIVPQLVDISNQRISSGSLKPVQLMKYVFEYNISVVLYYAERLVKIEEWNSFVLNEFKLSYYYNSTTQSWLPATIEMKSISQIENFQIWTK